MNDQVPYLMPAAGPTGPRLVEVDSTSRPVTADSEAQGVVVAGAYGGVGTTVLSALLAEYRHYTDADGGGGWANASAALCDLPARWSPEPGLVRACEQHTASQVSELRGAPVVDAGAQASTVSSLLLDTRWTPVLVIGVRPDLLNRARPVLSAWQEAGVLASSVVVLNCQVPMLNAQALSEYVQGSLAGHARAVLGVEYDPILGEGEEFCLSSVSERTAQSVAQLQNLISGTAEVVAAVVGQ